MGILLPGLPGKRCDADGVMMRRGETPAAEFLALVATKHADHDALHLALVGVDDARLHALVGRLEADLVAAFLVEALERGLAAVEQGHDLLAVARALAALDDDVVAVAEVVVDHAVAADAQDVHPVLRVEHLLEVELLAVFDGLDGGAGGDVAEQRELGAALRSEERRVGKECRSRWWAEEVKTK